MRWPRLRAASTTTSPSPAAREGVSSLSQGAKYRYIAHRLIDWPDRLKQIPWIVTRDSIMRPAGLLVSLSLFYSCAALAQAPQVQRIEIVKKGIYNNKDIRR